MIKYKHSMRTTLIILSLGLAAFAADAPKPVVIPTLTTAERIALNVMSTRSKELVDQQKQLAEQFAQVQREACQREYKQDNCQITEKGEIVVAPVKDVKK